MFGKLRLENNYEERKKKINTNHNILRMQI